VAVRSAGILLYRLVDGAPEVLLGHPGGPFWARKDAGAWSVPKGEYVEPEAPLAAARREFAEELGLPVPDGPAVELGSVKQPSGKVVTVWAVCGDLDPDQVRPGVFALEWPPRSGRTQEFPEVDRVAWFDLATARDKLLRGQVPFLDRLTDALAAA
jgi:predicted NUDIX family NTP pyrophosphohydrolase